MRDRAGGPCPSGGRRGGGRVIVTLTTVVHKFENVPVRLRAWPSLAGSPSYAEFASSVCAGDEAMTGLRRRLSDTPSDETAAVAAEMSRWAAYVRHWAAAYDGSRGSGRSPKPGAYRGDSTDWFWDGDKPKPVSEAAPREVWAALAAWLRDAAEALEAQAAGLQMLAGTAPEPPGGGRTGSVTALDEYRRSVRDGRSPDRRFQGRRREGT
jgi:hypothetical protein